MLKTFVRRSAFMQKSFNLQNILLSENAALSATQTRNSSYRSSGAVKDLSEYPEIEVVQNPPEWKYVERLIAPGLVPQPSIKKTFSGWQAQKPDLIGNEKFYISRSKNHMVPVYLQRKFRGQRRITIVKHIEGDIWSFEQDLRKVVETARGGRLCASRVNEMSGQVHFHGDYVNLIKNYLVEKGF